VTTTNACCADRQRAARSLNSPPLPCVARSPTNTHAHKVGRGTARVACALIEALFRKGKGQQPVLPGSVGEDVWEWSVRGRKKDSTRVEDHRAESEQTRQRRRGGAGRGGGTEGEIEGEGVCSPGGRVEL
jgi:hypothetical protein